MITGNDSFNEHVLSVSKATLLHDKYLYMLFIMGSSPRFDPGHTSKCMCSYFKPGGSCLQDNRQQLSEQLTLAIKRIPYITIALKN